MSSSHEDSSSYIPQDMNEALEKFEAECQKTIDSFKEGVEACPLPSIIYHYTNDVGLRGILESGRLWLNDIFNLNDPSELKHGICLAVGILNSKAANGPGERQEFARFFEKFVKSSGNIELGNYFICSFSSCGNDLGQWRAYADNGRGYAPGFDAKALQVAFEENKYGRVPGTFPLKYSDVQLKEIHTSFVESLAGLIPWPGRRNLSRSESSSFLTKLATALFVKVALASLYFKHQAYSNESEYRFLELHGKMEPEQVKQRPRRYSWVRYREFDWKQAAAETLKKIVVGPAADQKGIQFANDCVRMFCSSSVEIVKSRIPYRAL